MPSTLAERIGKAIELFPCDALFIHRDAEREDPHTRHTEIRAAYEAAIAAGCSLPAVAIVPVRMLEAWLLFDERAIRHAAGNPNGKVALSLPPLERIEERPNPKKDLREALKSASELKGRRLKKFNTSHAFGRVVDFLDDFSPLRQLPAYAAFENAVSRIRQNEWRPGFYGID
jgi:hypothetical protein